MAKGFFVGVFVTLLAFAAGAFVFVKTGALPAGQDVKPGRLEKWAAKTSLRATVRRESKSLKSPIEPSAENLEAGVLLYQTHCQVCHGGSDGEASPIAKGLSPDAPQLAKHGVTDDPEGVIYWKVAHGIRFTGMPGFRSSLSEKELWQMTLFLKQMDDLPAGAKQRWGAAKAAP